jgi:hypothetical protein
MPKIPMDSCFIVGIDSLGKEELLLYLSHMLESLGTHHSQIKFTFACHSSHRNFAYIFRISLFHASLRSKMQRMGVHF